MKLLYAVFLRDLSNKDAECAVRPFIYETKEEADRKCNAMNNQNKNTKIKYFVRGVNSK